MKKIPSAKNVARTVDASELAATAGGYETEIYCGNGILIPPRPTWQVPYIPVVLPPEIVIGS